MPSELGDFTRAIDVGRKSRQTAEGNRMLGAATTNSEQPSA